MPYSPPNVTPEMLDASPGRIIYGRSFKWTRLGGTVSTWGGSGYHTQEQCDRETFAHAISIGWTPPKWWQFWRWDDYPRSIPSGTLKEEGS